MISVLAGKWRDTCHIVATPCVADCTFVVLREGKHIRKCLLKINLQTQIYPLTSVRINICTVIPDFNDTWCERPPPVKPIPFPHTYSSSNQKYKTISTVRPIWLCKRVQSYKAGTTLYVFMRVWVCVYI